MRIAASTTTTRDLPLLESIALAADLHYDGLEVWVEHLWAQEVAPGVVRTAAAARGLALTMHGPQRDLNVASANAGIRTESQRQYLATLDDAAALGAEVLVLHPGAMSSAGDVPQDFWPVLDEFFGRVADRAAALGVCVGVENMERRRREFVIHPDLVVGLLQRVGRPTLGLTLDVAHLLYNGDPLALDGLTPYLFHVHISGSTKQKVHVPLAEGIYDLRPAVAALQRDYRGLVAVEGYVRGKPRETLAANHRTIYAWLAG